MLQFFRFFKKYLLRCHSTISHIIKGIENLFEAKANFGSVASLIYLFHPLMLVVKLLKIGSGVSIVILLFVLGYFK